LLTRSRLTYPEVSSKVYHDSFCQLDSSVSLTWVIHFEAFYLHVVSSFSCIPVICTKLLLFLTPLQFVHLFCNLSQVYPAVLLMYFNSVSVMLGVYAPTEGRNELNGNTTYISNNMTKHWTFRRHVSAVKQPLSGQSRTSSRYMESVYCMRLIRHSQLVYIYISVTLREFSSNVLILVDGISLTS